MAIQATSEEQLRMRRRARRRLLGAATLLLLAAIVLPMLLDKQPRPLDRDIEIRIPSPTAAPMASAPPVASSTPSVPPTTIQSAPVATDKTAPPSPATTVDRSEPAISPSKPSADANAAHEVIAPKTAAAPKPEQTSGKTPEKAAQKTEPTHKATKEALEKPAVSTHFVVQLGAFSNAENVRQLRDKLLAGGIHTYTEGLPGGATRVRAGPFKTREQADSTQARIALLGVQATVVSLDKP